MAEKSRFPDGCNLIEEWRVATYRDCYRQACSLSDTESITGLFVRVMAKPPRWITALMSLRNAIVRFFGLKTDNPNPDFEKDNPLEYKVGDHISLFKIEKILQDELIVSANDKHLDASFSLLISKDRQVVYMTSVVKTKRKLGDIYMFVIAPFHRLIVRYMLGKLNRR